MENSYWVIYRVNPDFDVFHLSERYRSYREAEQCRDKLVRAGRKAVIVGSIEEAKHVFGRTDSGA